MYFMLSQLLHSATASTIVRIDGFADFLVIILLCNIERGLLVVVLGLDASSSLHQEFYHFQFPIVASHMQRRLSRLRGLLNLRPCLH